MSLPEIDIRLDLGGNKAGPCLVYLPGLHGDGTLVTELRHELANDCRWVGVTYPRNPDWQLADYARAVTREVKREVSGEVWLLAESFGSQVAWELLDQPEPDRLQVAGLILAGGFGRHPWPAAVRLAQLVDRHAQPWLFRLALHSFALLLICGARLRPQARVAAREFVRRRLLPGDREAMTRRLNLIARNEPLTCGLRPPVFQLTGFWDLLVPWAPVSRWLRRNCSDWRGRVIIGGAGHAVLAFQPRKSANQIRQWLKSTPPSADRRRSSG